MKRTSHKQMSESLLTAAFLSVSGGLQDAYTYVFRGKVFANAQTGNIVAESFRMKYQKIQKIHWRQLILIIEILLLFVVGFLPTKWNLIANAMVSFSCAMQVQTFRKVNGYAFASTMCIGNIRSGMESLCAYKKTHDRDILYKSICYISIIIMFAFGAGLGEYFIQISGMRTIWFSCGLLFVSFLIMFIKEEVEEHPELKEEVEERLHEKIMTH